MQSSGDISCNVIAATDGLVCKRQMSTGDMMCEAAKEADALAEAE